MQPVVSFFLFLYVLFILEEAGEVLRCTSPYLDRLCKRASDEGRTRKEKHRLWETLTAKMKHQQGLVRLLSPEDRLPDRGTQMPT